jgi:predicted metal-dependent peptidase
MLEVDEKAPYFAPILWMLIPTPLPGLGTMGVSKKLHLYYDPEFLLTDPEFSDVNKLASVVMHECMHIFDGFERLEALPEKDMANLAADLAINWSLRSAGWDMPQNGAYPEQYDFPGNKLLEWYYDELMKKADKVRQQMSQQSQSGAGKPDKKDAQGKSGSKGQAGDDQGQGPGQSKGKPNAWGPCAGQCGSIAGNVKEGAETAVEHEDAGRSDEETKAATEAVAEAADNHQRLIGDVPGHLVTEIEHRKLPSKVDWRGTLRRVIRRCSGRVTAGGGDYSIRRPSRRAFARGLILPGLIENELVIAFIRDTSGSMHGEDLDNADTEAQACMRSAGVDLVWLCDADVKVQRPFKQVRLNDIPRLAPKGRGGTSFVQPLEAASRLRPRPDIVMYLTDGFGSAPPAPPQGMEVVWVIVPTSQGNRPAPWGHVVVCHEDAQLHDRYAE